MRRVFFLVAVWLLPAAVGAQVLFQPVVQDPQAPLPDFVGITYEAEDAHILRAVERSQ